MKISKPKMGDLEISVIIPAYNEEETITQTINEIKKTMEKISRNYEVVIVDDGSEDSTYRKAKKLQKEAKGKIKVFGYGKNKGKGFALRYGFFHSKGKIIVFIDADMDIHPNQIKNLLELMEQYNVDVVVGSKRHKDSKVLYPLKRKVLSELYYIFCKVLFRLDVKDTQTGLKVFRREVLEEVMPKILVKKYAFDLEILANARRKGYKIIEAPIKIEFKHNSHINFKEIINMLIDTLAIAYRMYIVKYYD